MACIFLGIDDGGAKTQAAICDETGRVLDMGIGACVLALQAGDVAVDDAILRKLAGRPGLQ